MYLDKSALSPLINKLSNKNKSLNDISNLTLTELDSNSNYKFYDITDSNIIQKISLLDISNPENNINQNKSQISNISSINRNLEYNSSEKSPFTPLSDYA